jgi:ferredoxin
MRVGSIIAQVRLSPTIRPYSNHNEYCLFFAHGICGKCISRCPVEAITKNGKDKDLCYKHLIPDTQDYVTSSYGFNGHACGLCQTGVPCESKIPKKKDGL